MKKILLAVGLFLGSLTPVWASEEDVQATIQGQIDALQADDFATAFSFASPMIKGIFRNSSDAFGTMVRRGYPMVHRPAAVQFLEYRDVDGRILQVVQIRDQLGRFHTLGYEMINVEDGWKINGVQMLEAPQVGV